MYRVGDKWHAMELVEIRVKDVNEYDTDGDGNTYVASSYPQKTVTIACACGKTMDVPFKEFRKRDWRDCGCGRSWGGRQVIGSFSLPLDLKEHLDRFAIHQKRSQSQVIIMALTNYFAKQT